MIMCVLIMHACMCDVFTCRWIRLCVHTCVPVCLSVWILEGQRKTCPALHSLPYFFESEFVTEFGMRLMPIKSPNNSPVSVPIRLML